MGLVPSEDAARAAMSEACSYVRRYPKLVHWMQTGDVEAERILDNFRNRTPVTVWLRRVSYRRHEDVLVELLDAADVFVNRSGQAARIMETYRQQRDSAKLDELSSSARAVHRAVYSLGIYQGAPVLGSLRYVQTTVAAQSQNRIRLSPRAVQKHIEKLVERGLFLSYDPGRRSTYGNESGTIDLELSPVASEPDVDMVLLLSLTLDQRLALSDYVIASQERRKKVLADLDDRRSRMHAALIDLSDVLRGIDLDADWIEVPTITGSSVCLPHHPIDGYVLLEDGSRVDYFFALALVHECSCESSHLPPLMCPCASAKIEEACAWVSWGNAPVSHVVG
ncbi:hypothetical protein [Nocardioides bizhenqiangii]|uniref:MarR family transcriptional regulator n=1 Tax=Nocardioides bizhenqiangii TaxID=3095076 RepID=A0ABZ0ZR41_9ACTN|nr:hypothetical protein [Nocardioides sp. HM61]WQQ26814.1 hypothetical protein SHK19_00945 [Nocardioides sp. HM61]